MHNIATSKVPAIRNGETITKITPGGEHCVRVELMERLKVTMRFVRCKQPDNQRPTGPFRVSAL